MNLQAYKPHFGKLMQRRNEFKFNTKRKLEGALEPNYLDAFADSVRYGGNPEHKRNPGDFGLTPPAQPRPDKTLCDIVGIFTRQEAVEFLRAGIRRGLVSKGRRNNHPQNVWAVTEDGYPLEFQLENPVQATYHGYPMPDADAFREAVLTRWNGP